VWPRRAPAELTPIDRSDVDAVLAALFDVIHELRSIEALLEEDDDAQEDVEDDDR
jgi:hypothetical protein